LTSKYLLKEVREKGGAYGSSNYSFDFILIDY